MAKRSVFLIGLGLVIWAAGLWVFLTGSYLGGGLLILLGGLCLAIAADIGWGDLFEGLANWLFFWR